MRAYRLMKKWWQVSADLSAKRRSAFLFLLPIKAEEKGGEVVMRRRLNRKGQSTLEYVIIWTAIVAAILIAANQFLRPAIEGAVDTTSTKITEEVVDLTDGLGN